MRSCTRMLKTENRKSGLQTSIKVLQEKYDANSRYSVIHEAPGKRVFVYNDREKRPGSLAVFVRRVRLC